jgi:hypothetical protein
MPLARVEHDRVVLPGTQVPEQGFHEFARPSKLPESGWRHDAAWLDQFCGVQEADQLHLSFHRRARLIRCDRLLICYRA